MLVNYADAAHWPIDPTRQDLVEEMRASPRGPHSDDLRKLLHRMRWTGVGKRHVLIVLEPNRRWMLGRLPGRRGAPVETFPNRIFTSLAEAEWAVFVMRWEALTGQRLDDGTPAP
ncbi:hypothetical protein [Bosea sp. (in: a-proteobacteria)]|jgi:hypothetical protein|uniref:hypothetical protein n=1 Tax=Bosea sp. (in: a-proteobacteria) TaxID=1871050 RepID=UPI003F6EEF64